MKKKELSFVEIIRKIQRAGIESKGGILNNSDKETDELEPIGERLQKILQIVKSFKGIPENMIFFIMYDIEHNKIRTQIAKYLIANGCTRIQKSVYLAELNRKKYIEIHDTLKEIQQAYDNNDSIMFVPVSSDVVSGMKIIGQNISFDFILDNKNTVFF